MKILNASLLATSLVAMALPLAAQTTPAAKTPQTAVHRTTPVTHRPATSSCATALPTLSAKIPALPVGSPRCPSVGYSLTWIDTDPGTGELAAPKKWYTVHYTGYLADGTVFDSSVGKDPITFPYGAHRVITGWDTGFEGMRIGGKRRLFIPYQLAYGAAGKPPVIPEKATLIFDVQLISQSDAPPAPKTPVAPKISPVPPPPPPPTPAGTTATPPASSQAPAATVPPLATPKK
jgi:peptidylprolyl isomerase